MAYFNVLPQHLSGNTDKSPWIRLVGVLAKIQTSTSKYKLLSAPTYSISFSVVNSEESKHVVVYYIKLLSLHIQNTNIIGWQLCMMPRCHRMTKIFSWTATLCKFILQNVHNDLWTWPLQPWGNHNILSFIFSLTVQEYQSSLSCEMTHTMYQSLSYTEETYLLLGHSWPVSTATSVTHSLWYLIFFIWWQQIYPKLSSIDGQKLMDALCTRNSFSKL